MTTKFTILDRHPDMVSQMLRRLWVLELEEFGLGLSDVRFFADKSYLPPDGASWHRVGWTTDIHVPPGMRAFTFNAKGFLRWKPAVKGIDHLILIDTASRLATRVINGRKTSVSIPIGPDTTPEEIEAFRNGDAGQFAFERIVCELQLHDKQSTYSSYSNKLA